MDASLYGTMGSAVPCCQTSSIVRLKAARPAQNTNAYMNEQEPLVGPCDGLECLVYAVQNIVRDTRRDDALEAA